MPRKKKPKTQTTNFSAAQLPVSKELVVAKNRGWPKGKKRKVGMNSLSAGVTAKDQRARLKSVQFSAYMQGVAHGIAAAEAFNG